jgi:hypothetical protein
MMPKNQLFERHFSPRTLAEVWGFSEDTILRWFEDVPGVLKCGAEGGRGKRRKVTIRIPESIALSVYSERIR